MYSRMYAHTDTTPTHIHSRTHACAYIHTYIQTDRKTRDTDKHAENQTRMHTYIHKDRQTNRQTGFCANAHTHAQTYARQQTNIEVRSKK